MGSDTKENDKSVKQHQLYRNLHIGMDHVLQFMGEKPLPSSMTLQVDQVSIQDIWSMLVDVTQKRKQMLKKAKMKQKKKQLHVETTIIEKPTETSKDFSPSGSEWSITPSPRTPSGSPKPSTEMKIPESSVKVSPKTNAAPKEQILHLGRDHPEKDDKYTKQQKEMLKRLKQHANFLDNLEDGSKKCDALLKWMESEQGKNAQLSDDLAKWLEQKRRQYQEKEDAERKAKQKAAIEEEKRRKEVRQHEKQQRTTAKPEPSASQRQLRTRRPSYAANSDEDSDEAEFQITSVEQTTDELLAAARDAKRNRRRHSVPAPAPAPPAAPAPEPPTAPTPTLTMAPTMVLDLSRNTTETVVPQQQVIVAPDPAPAPAMVSTTSQPSPPAAAPTNVNYLSYAAPIPSSTITAPTKSATNFRTSYKTPKTSPPKPTTADGSTMSSAIVLEDSDDDEDEDDTKQQVEVAAAPKARARTKVSTRKKLASPATLTPPKRKRTIPEPSPPPPQLEEEEDEEEENDGSETDEDNGVFDLEEPDVYVVESILARKVGRTINRGRKESDLFLVKWEGYSELTWEPEANIPTRLIDFYEDRMQKRIACQHTIDKVLARNVVKNSTTNRDETIYLIKWSNQPTPIWECRSNLPEKTVVWLEKVNRAQLTAPPPKKRTKR